MSKHIVTAEAVTANVGQPGETPVVVYVYRGQYLPAGTLQTDLEHLLRLNLVAEEHEAEADLAAAHVVDGQVVTGAVTIPPGEPTEGWKVDELKAYAAAKGVDLGAAKTKADIVTVLADAAKAAEAEATREAEAQAERERLAADGEQTPAQA